MKVRNRIVSLILAMVLLIGSIIWRIVRSCVENNRLNP